MGIKLRSKTEVRIEVKDEAEIAQHFSGVGSEKILKIHRIDDIKQKVLDAKQLTSEETEIYNKFLDCVQKIHANDRNKANTEAIFFISHIPTKVIGLISHSKTDNVFTLRMFDSRLVLLKSANQSVIEKIIEIGKIHNTNYSFPEKKTDIWEIEHKIELCTATILPHWKERLTYVYRQNKSETIILICVTAILLVLLWGSYPGHFITNGDNLVSTWLYDILTKLVGPLFVTALINLSVLFRTLLDVANKKLIWDRGSLMEDDEIANA